MFLVSWLFIFVPINKAGDQTWEEENDEELEIVPPQMKRARVCQNSTGTGTLNFFKIKKLKIKKV